MQDWSEWGTCGMENEIKKIITELGADVCGIASVERFGEAPIGFAPTDLYAECKTVIAIGIALPKGLLEVDPRLVYTHFNGTIICDEVDHVSMKAAKVLEEKYNCKAVPVPCDTPSEYWEPETMTAKGMLSMKHVAVQCGIGQVGKSSLLLNSIYGNRLTIGAILTDLKLSSDELCEDICISSCKLCEEICPVHAIKDKRVDQKRCRPNLFGKTARGYVTMECNRCRTVCPMRFGKSTTDEKGSS